MEKVLLKVEEAAELLSLGRSAVYEAIRVGRLESVTVGRSRRVPSEAITRFAGPILCHRVRFPLT